MLQREDILERWRNRLFSICVLFAAIGTVCEIVIYLLDSKRGGLFLPNRLYRIRFIYIPSSANLVLIIITRLCLISKKISSNAKNTWSCILIFFLCANMQILHYVYGPMAILPVIAIMISSMYANRLLTLSLSIASSFTLIINAVFALKELRKDDPWVITEIALSFTVIWVSFIASRLLTSFVDEQMKAVVSGRQREGELMVELKLDGLMGISNRKALDESLSKIVSGLVDSSHIYLMLLDVDHFKTINDTYGHSCGDKVLFALSSVIRNHTSEQIQAYRYGGDEIILIFKNHTKDECQNFANTLLNEFKCLTFPLTEKAQISFSAGIVRYHHGMNSETWLNAADQLLYRVKKSGRGHIAVEETD